MAENDKPLHISSTSYPFDRDTTAIIYALLNAPDPVYALSLAQTTGVRIARLYVILDRLLKAGWATKSWGLTPGGGARRVYELTDHGVEHGRRLLDLDNAEDRTFNHPVSPADPGQQTSPADGIEGLGL